MILSFDHKIIIIKLYWKKLLLINDIKNLTNKIKCEILLLLLLLLLNPFFMLSWQELTLISSIS